MLLSSQRSLFSLRAAVYTGSPNGSNSECLKLSLGTDFREADYFECWSFCIIWPAAVIAGINLNGQPCLGLILAAVQLSEKCNQLQKHMFTVSKSSSLTAARLLQLHVPRADQ